MDIGIVDSKAISSFRLGSIIENIEGVSNVIHVMDPSKALKTLECMEPDIIIYNINVNGANHIKTLGILRETYPGIKIIVLVGSMIRDYCEKFNQLGIEHCLDSTRDFDKIPIIIEESVKDQTKL